MTGFFLTNQNTLYLLRLFYSDNEIITLRGRPTKCTLIGWFKSSRLFISLLDSVLATLLFKQLFAFLKIVSFYFWDKYVELVAYCVISRASINYIFPFWFCEGFISSWWFSFSPNHLCWTGKRNPITQTKCGWSDQEQQIWPGSHREYILQW